MEKSSLSYSFFMDSIKYFKNARNPFSYYKSIYPTLSEKVLDLFKYFYNSSVVFVNVKMPAYVCHVTKIDVNSFYPSIFLKYPMPYGEPVFANNYVENDPNYYYLITAEVYFEDMIYKYFPLKSTFGSFKSGKTIVSFFDFEIKNIKRCFKVFKFKIIAVIAFKKQMSYLRDYIKDYYENKIKAFPRGSEERAKNKEKINVFLGHMCKSTASDKSYYYRPVGMVMRAISKKIILDYCFEVIGMERVIAVYSDSIVFLDDEDILKEIPISDQIGDFKLEFLDGTIDMKNSLCYHIWDANRDTYKNKKRFHFVEE